MDKKQGKPMHKFGLIGKDISYSFSRNYFKNKFENENIKEATYTNFDIKSIEAFKTSVLNVEGLAGANVTIPYKEVIIPYLNKLSKKAKKIGAVNTIKLLEDGKTKGYNTDCYGFKKVLKPHLKKHHKKALILGTGGASKAVAYALKELGIKYKFVSRNASNGKTLTYKTLTKTDIKKRTIIINTTPLGTFPNIESAPDLPYNALSENHILFDLVYNPEKTQFLKFGEAQNATIINGYNMLVFQAEKAWEIWNR